MAGRGNRRGKLDRLPITEGAAIGLMAWLVGLAIVILIVLIETMIGGRGRGGWEVIFGQGLFFFFSAHLWPALIGDGALTASLLIETAIIAAILVGGGYILTGRSVEPSPLGGATVTVGYLSVTIFAVFLFGFGLSPTTVIVLLFTGVIFPLVFGAIGGALATRSADNGNHLT